VPGFNRGPVYDRSVARPKKYDPPAPAPWTDCDCGWAELPRDCRQRCGGEFERHGFMGRTGAMRGVRRTARPGQADPES
jgi:hypothetical protein